MDFSDPRLRFIINPGNLDEPTFQTPSEDEQYGKRLARTKELIKDWRPKLLEIIGDEFEADKIIKALDPETSAATRFQSYSKSNLDLKMIDNYIQDAYQNGGFKLKNNKRTRIFRETEFAKDLSCSLNQLAFINMTGRIMYSMERTLDKEKCPNKKMYLSFFKKGFYALRELILNKEGSVDYTEALMCGGLLDLPYFLSDNFRFAYLTDKEVETFRDASKYVNDEHFSEIDRVKYKLKQRFYDFCYPNGFQGPLKETNYLRKDLDQDKMFEIVAEGFQAELAYFLDLKVQDIGAIINSSQKPRV